MTSQGAGNASHSMPDLKLWYEDLTKVKNYLLINDPTLKQVFDKVDANNFLLHTAIKQPYPALIGVIIGQRITYVAAKKLRSALYSRYGTEFTPQQLHNQDLSFLGPTPANIIKNVTTYILQYNIDIAREAGIRSLIYVEGIGEWTINSTLITSMINWNLFPTGDKFLHNRLIKLYGKNYNPSAIISKWSPYSSVVTWYLWRWF